MKSVEYKKRKIGILDIAHNCNLESINVKCKTYVTCEIILHVALTVNKE